MSLLRTICLLLCLSLPAAATAQSTPPADLMIVLDGSGSMWGQIGGRSKIEIARETLSSVLEETVAGQNIGMMAYGHRVRGQCSDIELMAALGPARHAAPRIVQAANRLNPVGMTPLTEAVRQAAGHLRFTERAATVVLITDGIETCDADPCALGRELAQAGLDFTAHVVGFGMSTDEGAQVACLAQTTGGQFFLANDAQALADALGQTLAAEPAPVEPAEPANREVHLLLRDVPGDELLRGTPVLSLSISAHGADIAPDIFIPAPSVKAAGSASVNLPAGDYVLTADVASDRQRKAYRAVVPFTVAAGDGPQIVDLVLGARLRIRPMISANEPFTHGLPSATGGTLRLDFLLTPVIAGQALPERAVRIDNVGARLPPTGYEAAFEAGTWLVRGTLGNVFAREKRVEVVSGQTTELVFDFQASRVLFDFDDGGTPVRTPTFYPFDTPESTSWAEARWRNTEGQLLPLFMPTGTWLLRGGDYHNAANRTEVIIEIPEAGRTLTVRPRSGERVSGDELDVFRSLPHARCLKRAQPRDAGACLVEQASY